MILEDIHVVPNPPLVSHRGLLLEKYSILYFIPEGDSENMALVIYLQSNNQTTEQTHTYYLVLGILGAVTYFAESESLNFCKLF